ncbi:MAG: rRNA pseudouridine synthase [Muribaculaceae bacterium]|nr:rRNA pseudouridine synthase [Roseburia sp.]MCM1430388.1 rRNA pseudouridine synthase [Muribaculaceae bacterium]MCM1492416.1 rRNA pseudouridine synthase [Muribaculaceae bacterium]
MLRLDKFLADAGLGTRSEVKKYIKDKSVTVDGVPALQPQQKIDPGQAQVCFRGKPVIYEEFSYYLFHKPAGAVTARRDKRTTVMDFFPEEKREKLSPVGRLDKDTEGLLLLTDDGALLHHLTSPAHHVEKTYYVILDSAVSGEAVECFARGVEIGDERPTRPARLEILSEEEPFDPAFAGKGGAHAKLTISEGRYHQVKRMFAAIGCEVLYLKRLSLGGLALGNLKRGEYRRLTDAELQLLRDAGA